MATRRVRQKHNQTKKRKNKKQVKKGGSVQCTYDKNTQTLNIIMKRAMLEGNLHKIQNACEKVIKDSSPEKVFKKASSKKASAQASVPKNSMFKGFPTAESTTSNKGLYDGRRDWGFEL
jgi:hypothetical protein